jgi:hypothetical protein
MSWTDQGTDLAPVLEIVLNDGTLDAAVWGSTTNLYLSGGVASALGKAYHPNVVEWGSTRRGFQIRASDLQPAEIDVLVADDDGTIRDAIENGQQRGSAATIYHVFPGDATNSRTVFTGVLERWGYRSGVVLLTLRADDGALRDYVPNWSISKSDWPGAPTPSLGLYAPIIYGTHNSSGLSGTGMVKCIPVYEVAEDGTYKYLVCAGQAKEVLAVYVNGASQTITTDYTLSYSTSVAGKMSTVITFVSSKAADAVVTADVKGYEVTGNTGSGTTAPTGVQITNPVEQMRHLLINFAETNWLTGAWYGTADSSLIDAESWAECAQWAERQLLEGTLYVGGDAMPLQVWDVLDEWLASWPCFRAYWTASGRLALRVFDLAFPGYRASTDAPVLEPAHELEGSAEYDLDATDVTSEFLGSYLYDEVQQQYVASMAVHDPTVTPSVSTLVELKDCVRRAV